MELESKAMQSYDGFILVLDVQNTELAENS